MAFYEEQENLEQAPLLLDVTMVEHRGNGFFPSITETALSDLLIPPAPIVALISFVDENHAVLSGGYK